MYLSHVLSAHALGHFLFDAGKLFIQGGDLGFILCSKVGDQEVAVGLWVEAFVVSVEDLCVLVLLW